MNHYREGVSPLPHLASNNRFKSRKSVAVALSTMFAATMMFATNTSEVHAGAATCSKGGSCKVGDVGPAGGIVFYDAGSLQWWGRYLEVPRGIPVGTNLNGLVWSPEPARTIGASS